MNLKVKNGIVRSSKCIPHEPRWFADGRLSFEFSSYGITRVHYMFPMEVFQNHAIFYQRNWDGFRFYIEKDHLNYKPEFSNCRIWPYGMEADWRFDSFIFKFRVYAVGEAISVQLETPPDTPQGMHYKIEFYDNFALVPCDVADLRMSSWGTERHWKDWQFEEDSRMLCGGFIEKPNDGSKSADLDITITSDFPLQYDHKKVWNKRILKSDTLSSGKTYSYLIDFSYHGKAINKAQKKLDGLSGLIRQQVDRYELVASRSPVLVSPYKHLNDFVSLAPMYHEVSKVPYIPGAIRASNVYYWVWGWDGMTSNFSTSYWGDTELIKGMLELYEKTADPEKGIVHAFRYDMVPSSISALPAQGMYICLLQNYYFFTKDIDTVRKHYEFARKTFRRIAAREAGNTGFCKGTSLYPDFPEYMLETGNDLSAFNNTVFYCSARSLAYLASLVGDEEGLGEAQVIAQKIEKSFARLFFDEKTGFVASSIDSNTLAQRPSYNLSALKWENSYLCDLLEPISEKCTDFVEKNFISAAGLRETPVWSEAFDGDANQLHCWWPVNSEYFIRTANGNNKTAWIEKFISYIEHFTQKLCCPEGISYYYETSEPDFDRWTTLAGVWQAYSIRGWYQAVIHGIVGFEIDAGGFTFFPYDGKEMKLKGLWYLGRQFDIVMKGSGKYIEFIVVDGTVLKGTHKLPVDCFDGRKKVQIIVCRTQARPEGPYIKQAVGVELSSYSFSDGVLKARMMGEGICRLKVAANTLPRVLVDGAPCAVLYDMSFALATAEIAFRNGEVKVLSIEQ